MANRFPHRMLSIISVYLKWTFLLFLISCPDVADSRYKHPGLSLHFNPQEQEWGAGSLIHFKNWNRETRDKDLPLHSRLTRSVSDESDKADAKNRTTVYAFSDHHATLVVHWAGRGSEVIIALGKNRFEDTSSVYFSKDYGKSFEKVDDKLMINATTPSIIHKYYNSSDSYIFTDTKHDCLFITKDSGKTFRRVCGLPFKPTKLSINPYNFQTVLGIDPQSSGKKLYISHDFGITWRKVYDKVKEFFWGVYLHDGADYQRVVYILEQLEEGKGQLVKYTDRGADGPPTFDSLASDVLEASVEGSYIYATKIGNLSSNSHMQLWVSYDRQPLKQAMFPINATNVHITEIFVTDMSEGQLMACVSVNSSDTNLYISEVKGHRFTMSLEKIVFFNPRSTNRMSWIRFYTNKTFADITRVAGVPGVYIASQQTKDELSLTSQRTLISFDKGGNWDLISPPAKILSLHPEACAKTKEGTDPSLHYKLSNCSLHLTQEYSRIYFESQISPVLSLESAPGLILASGMLGESLKTEADLFVSSDAGVTWRQALSGPYLYAMGDHGGIMVAISHNVPTNHIYYSIDEGQTWQSYRFVADEISVYGLLTEPGEMSSVFSVFGSRLPHHSWLILQIDFKNAFQDKVCQPEDYKWWSFGESQPDKNWCLLGRLTKYQRRVMHSVCFNGRDFVRRKTVENCACTREDFECSFGFEQTHFLHGCQPIPGFDFNQIHKVPSDCQEGAFYPYYRGYRKVAGDTCEGGVEHRLGPLSYSCPIAERTDFLVLNLGRHAAFVNLADGSRKIVPFPDGDTASLVTFDYKNNCEIYIAGQTAVKSICFGSKTKDRTSETIRGIKAGSDIRCLAYEWTGHTLYMCDHTDHSIFVRSVKGPFERKLYDGTHGVIAPRSLVLDPLHGYLFYVDQIAAGSHDYGIFRGAMDGTDPKMTLVANQSYVGAYTALTYDLESEQLYWDTNGRLMTSDIFGGNVTVLYAGNSKLTDAAGIAVYKNEVYVTREMGSSVYFKSPASDMWRHFPIEGSVEGILGMMAVSDVSQHAVTACSQYNIPCSQLCLPRPTVQTQPSDTATDADTKTQSHHHDGGARGQDRTCLCGEGYRIRLTGTGHNEACSCQPGEQLSKDGLCQLDTNGTTCGQDQYKCTSGQCIYGTWLCDGDADCTDGSDEVGCALTTCGFGSFTCANGKCIMGAWRCDREDDCHDGHRTDEMNCEKQNCSADQFQCADQYCIHRSWRCDGDNDCHDFSDEQNCTDAPGCRTWEFECDDGTCIGLEQKCNAIPQCPDHSDEKNCSNANAGNNTCSAMEFACGDGNCTHVFWVCDGMDDCPDGSDEKHCPSMNTSSTHRPPSVCEPGAFKCLSGPCIPVMYVCNGISDCADHTDEYGCDDHSPTSYPRGPTNFTTMAPNTPYGQCGPKEYTCERPENSTVFDRRCLWRSWLCDGDRDCPLGDDEINCYDKCVHPHFTCVFDGNCVPQAKVCDGHTDCIDGTDEEGCPAGTTVPTPATNYTCSSQDYSPCGDEAKSCVPFTKVCDRRKDCRNGRDEDQCQACQGLGRVVVTSQMTSSYFDLCRSFNCEASLHFSASDTTITVYWQRKSGNKLMLAYTTQPEKEKEKATKSRVETFAKVNMTTVRGNVKLDQLSPATTYQFVFLVVRPNGSLCPVGRAKQATQEGISDPPHNLHVSIKGDEDASSVVLMWEKPMRINGRIQSYVIYFQQLSEGKPQHPVGRVRMLTREVAGLDQHTTSSGDREYYYQIPQQGYFTWNKRYKLWIAAKTEQGVGKVSEVKTFLVMNQKTPHLNLKTNVLNETAIKVTWKKDSLAASYRVIGVPVGGQEQATLDVDKASTSVILSDLCPGTTFRLSVHDFHGASSESVHHLEAVTLPGVASSVSNVSVRSTGPTSVMVGFESISSVNYIYLTTHGTSTSGQTLFNPHQVALHQTRQREVKGLYACERYWVGVVPAHPSCRLYGVQTFATLEDEKAPPKHVAASVISTGARSPPKLRLTWNASCYKLARPLRYVIRMKMEGTGYRSFTTSIPTTNTHLTFKLPEVIPGQTYTFRIRASVEGARESTPIQVHIAEESSPWHLSVARIGKQEVRLEWDWDNTSTPQFKEYMVKTRLDSGKFTMENLTTSSSIQLVLPSMGIYFLQVSAITGDLIELGRSSMLQYDLYAEPGADHTVAHNGDSSSSDSVSLSKTNLLTIVIPVAGVVLVLSSVVIFMLLRHRRLQRSFLAYANSHYNIQSGTTTFSDDLDGDEPLIQGFSDDEPLVIG